MPYVATTCTPAAAARARSAGSAGRRRAGRRRSAQRRRPRAVVEQPVQLGRHQREERRAVRSAPRSRRRTRGARRAAPARCPATSERQITCTPATYDAGRASSHWPGPPSRRCGRRARRRAPRRGSSTTRFGRTVEPDVSTTSGSGSLGAPASRQRVHDLAVPPTGRRTSMRRSSHRPAECRRAAGGTGTAARRRGPARCLLNRRSWQPPPSGSRAPVPAPCPRRSSPVLAGTGVAAYDDGSVWWKALLALVVSLALQVGGQLRQRLLRRHPRHRRRPGRPDAAGRLRGRRARAR